jgi:FkbM family methyltransferase
VTPNAPPSVLEKSAAPATRRQAGWWRRLRKTPGYRRVKLFLKRIVGREPWLAIDVRRGLERHGDWAFLPGELPQGAVIYAFGVGTDLGFELALIREFGAEVHAFDPSPESRRWIAAQRLPPALSFHPVAVGERDGTLVLRARESESRGVPIMYSAMDETRKGPAVEVECWCLDTAMRRLGHNHIDLIKLDVEGAEFAALRSMLAGRSRPRQVLVEFHHRFPGVGPSQTSAAVSALRKAGYQLAFISETGREFTFLRDA